GQGGVVGDETVDGTEAVIRHARFQFRGEPVVEGVSARRSEAHARIELDGRAGARSKELFHLHVFGKGRADVAAEIKAGPLAFVWLWRKQAGEGQHYEGANYFFHNHHPLIQLVDSAEASSAFRNKTTVSNGRPPFKSNSGAAFSADVRLP